MQFDRGDDYMIIPNFHLEQDEKYVYVKLKLPLFVLVDDDNFPVCTYRANKFVFKLCPYFLSLQFSGLVRQFEGKEFLRFNDIKFSPICAPYLDECEDLECGEDESIFVFPVPKKNIGENFSNLDQPKKLLAFQPKRIYSKQQKAINEESNQTYGFANSHSNIIDNIFGDANKLFDIIDPDKKTIAQRRKERFIQEADDFHQGYYLADLYENNLRSNVTIVPDSSDQMLTKSDKQRIKRLPKRDFPEYDQQTEQALLLGIMDILFSYVYVSSIYGCETNVQTAQSMVKLSPTLSCFEFWIPCDIEWNQNDKQYEDKIPTTSMDNMTHYAVDCIIRRALCYSFIRNRQLMENVFVNVRDILNGGRSTILKCFLDIRKIMGDYGENYHVFNQLYITDYCCWIKQKTNDEMFKQLALQAQILEDNRPALGLGLVELEIDNDLYEEHSDFDDYYFEDSDYEYDPSDYAYQDSDYDLDLELDGYKPDHEEGDEELISIVAELVSLARDISLKEDSESSTTLQ